LVLVLHNQQFFCEEWSIQLWPYTYVVCGVGRYDRIRIKS
jgi:hypothetical protein